MRARQFFIMGLVVLFVAVVAHISTEFNPQLEITDEAFAQQTPLASLQTPGFDVETPLVIYTQPQRASRGLHFWPDGNMGFIPNNNEYVFFAANSIMAARTSGTLDNPAFIVEFNGLPITGTSSEYSYVAGGPIYQDSETGMLLMFYHAERHFGGNGGLFYSELGLARSQNGGWSFEDLGIILKSNRSHQPTPSRAVEMAGAPYVILDGYFYVYFRDMLADGFDVNLAVARAPVDEVVQAAANGTTINWLKYYEGDFSEPGVGGRSTALEIGNPLNRWMSVSYNAMLDRVIMVVVETVQGNRTLMHLAASEDGIHWSPRVTLQARDGELFYPSIISAEGDPLQTGKSFYIYYTHSANGIDRWRDASLERIKVNLTGELIASSNEWNFDTDVEGWFPLNQISTFKVQDGHLVIEATGGDPYMHSANLGLSTEEFTHIEMRMKLTHSGTGQFFFTSSEAQGISEQSSVRFPVTGGGGFRTYRINMSNAPGWSGHLGFLRFDPVDQPGRIEIDYIKLTSQ